MRVASGFLDAQGSPRLRFELSGDSARKVAAECKLEGVIDTGFSGFISMPLQRAFPLRLLLAGFSTGKLADGRTSRDLTATGYARIGDRCEEVAVILGPQSDEVLIGVALLRALELALLITRDEVLLLDQESIDAFRPMDGEGLCVRDSVAPAVYGARSAS